MCYILVMKKPDLRASRQRIVSRGGLLLILILCLSSCRKEVYRYEARWPGPPEVEVVLSKKAKTVRLAIHSPYRLVDINTGRTLRWGDRHKETTVSFTNNVLVIGKDRLGVRGIKVVTRRDGAVELNGIRYRGEISLMAVPPNQLRAINRLDVEEYVQGVLGSEMPDYWNREALMAQAVSIRTYVLNRELEGKGFNSLHLAYRGTAKESWRLNKIVADTRGMVMFYRGRVFPAYFHSTCGGHTEDAAHVFGDMSIPPIRGVKCGFCNKSRYYRWQVEIKKAELEKKLRRVYPTLKGFISIAPSGSGPGGRASTVAIMHAGGSLKMEANEFRLLVGPNTIFSTAFSAEDAGDVVRFTGRGWGHGVGMCQYGAQKMAEEGYRWFEILSHYYPGVEFVKVYQ